jgi:hypothetical protein
VRRGETFALFGGPWMVVGSCRRARRRGVEREAKERHFLWGEVQENN